jgi:hypothetical protein
LRGERICLDVVWAESVEIGAVVVYKHINCLRRMGTSYFGGKSEVSLVTVIFGNSELYRTVDYSFCGIQANGTNLIS